MLRRYRVMVLNGGGDSARTYWTASKAIERAVNLARGFEPGPIVVVTRRGRQILSLSKVKGGWIQGLSSNA